MTSIGISYLLPIRTDEPAEELSELTAYLRSLARVTQVVVVDGSPEPAFGSHRDAWGSFALHVRPGEADRCRNGKSWGVHTGVRLARHERVVIADDDVRYDAAGLEEMARALDGAEVVRPQNHYRPLPWHAAWDASRSLVNRAFAVDTPGTLGIRRSAFLRMGGYDGDALYENRELLLTAGRSGAIVVDRPDLFVQRLPPTTGRFLSQRTRQAYEDLSQPLRLAGFLAIGPSLATMARRRRALRTAVGLGLAAVATAEVGRRRAGGRRVFPARISGWAPMWLAERAVCSWVAVGIRALGGYPYAGERFTKAGNRVPPLRSPLLDPPHGSRHRTEPTGTARTGTAR